MGNDIDIEKLEGFLLNTLGTDDKSSIEERLVRDKEFKELYLNLKSLKEGIRYHSLNEKKQILLDLEKANNKEDEIRVIPIFTLKKMLLAASIIGIIALITLRYYNHNEQKNDEFATLDTIKIKSNSNVDTSYLANKSIESEKNVIEKQKSDRNPGFIFDIKSLYTNPQFIATIIRSENDKTRLNNYNEAIEFYKQGNYNKAIELVSAGKEPTDMYLKGHCFFKLNKYAEAEGIFLILAKDEYFINQKEAEWYLLISYLAQIGEKRADAKILAEKISLDDESAFKLKAKQISSKLDK